MGVCIKGSYCVQQGPNENPGDGCAEDYETCPNTTHFNKSKFGKGGLVGQAPPALKSH